MAGLRKLRPSTMRQRKILNDFPSPGIKKRFHFRQKKVFPKQNVFGEILKPIKRMKIKDFLHSKRKTITPRTYKYKYLQKNRKTLPSWSKKKIYKWPIQYMDTKKLFIKNPECLMCTFYTSDIRDLEKQNRGKMYKIEAKNNKIRELKARCALNEHCTKCYEKTTGTSFIVRQIAIIESSCRNIRNLLGANKKIMQQPNEQLIL